MTPPFLSLLSLGMLVQRAPLPGVALPASQSSAEFRRDSTSLHPLPDFQVPHLLANLSYKAIHSPSTSRHHTIDHHHLLPHSSHQEARLGMHEHLHGVRERCAGGQPISPKGTRVAAAPVLNDIPAA